MPIKSCVVYFKDTVGTTDPNYVSNIDGGDAKQLEIPNYQRPFKWSKSHFEELWQDTIEAIEANEDEYYLGPVGLFNDDEPYGISVVDGQQRYTAVTLFSVALRDYCIGEGFYKSAWNINNILLWTNHNGHLKERLISGENKLKKDSVNQNSTQLSTLLRWPDRGVKCRKNPPSIEPTVIEIIENCTDEHGDAIPVGRVTDVKFRINKLTHSIIRNKTFVFNGNEVVFIDLDGGKDSIDVSVHGDKEDFEIKAIIRNNGPDEIELNTSSEEIFNPFQSDKEWLDAAHGGKRPNRSERMFLRHDEVGKLIEEYIGDLTKDEKLEKVEAIFRMFCKYKFTITLFPTLETALAYFEKINDSKFSEPLNVHDLINYSIEKISSEGYKQSLKHDTTLKEGEKISDYVKSINESWAEIEETLQPNEIKKKKEVSKVIGDFFHTFLLYFGKRWGKKKTLPKVKEILSQLGITEHQFSTKKDTEVQEIFASLSRGLKRLAYLSQTYALVAMPYNGKSKEIRLNNIFRIYQQHRSLLVAAIDEIRTAAFITAPTGVTIDFNNDGDYKTKQPDYHALEEKFIQLIEFHIARNVILRHDSDLGYSSKNWWGDIEKWNRAILWRNQDLNKKSGFAATDFSAILGKIEYGGTVHVKPPIYDGAGKFTGQYSETVVDLELSGLRSITIANTQNFIVNGKINEDIRKMRINKSHGTFLLYLIETHLRNGYNAASATWNTEWIDSEQSLEHILPQSAHSSKNLPLDDWGWWDPDGPNVENTEEIKDYVERLGNMCLVKTKHNSSYGNKGFNHKQRIGNLPDYPSLTSLTNSWELMIDLKHDVDTALLKTKEPFSNDKFGLPSHHAALPVHEWTKGAIDNRNDWLFDILAEILASKEELHQIKLNKFKEEISKIDDGFFQALHDDIVEQLNAPKEEIPDDWSAHFEAILAEHEVEIPQRAVEGNDVGDNAAVANPEDIVEAEDTDSNLNHISELS